MIILPCLEIFFSSFNYLFAVFMLGFIFLMIKGFTSL